MDTQVPQPNGPTDNVVDEAVHKELGDSLVRAATITSTLKAEQDSAGLSARIESSRDEESLGEDASKLERRIDAIDTDKDIILVNDADNEMFDVDELGGEEVFVAGQNENIVEEIVDAAQVSSTATTVTITTEEITLAQAHKALKTSKPKVKGIVFQEPGYKLKDLKLKEFDRIEEVFDREFRRVNIFEDFKIELVKGKEKRAGEELEQEITKKQKVDDNKEKEKLKQLMETIRDEEELELVLLVNFKESMLSVYYSYYTVSTAGTKVNAASEKLRLLVQS
nr:hypothetical protein [Tanacetum cinerariifolium]